MEIHGRAAHFCRFDGKTCMGARADILCPACARSSLYQGRLGLAKILLQKDQEQRQINQIFGRDHEPNSLKQSDVSQSAILHHLKRQNLQNSLQHQLQSSRERARAITIARSTAQYDVDDLKRSIAIRREKLRRHRATYASTSAALFQTEESLLSSIKKELRSAQRKHRFLQNDIVSARSLLCKEAANLAGLHRKRRNELESASVETFTIGGSELFSLRELHAISWTQFTSVMASIARLVVLACHYLHVRLPAQIVLPFRNHSQPAILSPNSSYEGWQSLSRDKASGIEPTPKPGNVPHVRPLHTDRDLSLLAKEDANLYARVSEAVALLAWDIAWLCRVQGIEIASENWTDFMEIGRNLWLLLLSDQEQRLKHSGERSANNAPSSDPNDVPSQNANPHKLTRTFHSFGLFSHGTAFNFLDSAAFSRSAEVSVSAHLWSFSHPSKINDNLKAMLQNEISGLEWELLEHADSDSTGNRAIDTGYKLVNDHGHTKRLRAGNIGVVEGSPRLTGEIDTQAEPDPPQNNPKGRYDGWTKLKSRNNP